MPWSPTCDRAGYHGTVGADQGAGNRWGRPLNFLKVDILKLSIWAFALNVVVILQGAFVRATGSGAGCGRHWPTCNGEIVPLSFTTQSIIEFSHRGLSSLVLLLGLWLLIRGWQLRNEQPGFRWFATASFVLVVVEALLGAATVLFELTGDNVSTARGIMVAAHLVNSMLLIGALSGTMVLAGKRPPAWPLKLSQQPLLTTVFGLGLALMLVLMFSGGIAAMGNTMFPSENLAEGVAMDFDQESHPLVRLRILHPIIAVSVGVFLFIALGFARSNKPVAEGRVLAQVLFGVYVVQLVVGAVNFAMLAPIVLQLLHLSLAVASFSLFTAVAVVTLGYPLTEPAVPAGRALMKLENAESK